MSDRFRIQIEFIHVHMGPLRHVLDLKTQDYGARIKMQTP